MKNMTRLLSFALFSIVVLSGCNKLKDTKLNNNPYDKNYEGSKVVSISSVSTTLVSGVPRNDLTVTINYNLYEKVVLYRDGVVKGTFSRMNYSSGSTFTESFSDTSPENGKTYTYQVALTYDSGTTSLSDSYVYTTP